MAQLHLDRKRAVGVLLKFTHWIMGILLLAEDLWHLHQPLFGGLHDVWSSCLYFWCSWCCSCVATTCCMKDFHDFFLNVLRSLLA